MTPHSPTLSREVLEALHRTTLRLTTYGHVWYQAKVVAAAGGEEKTGREANAEWIQWKGALHSGGYIMLSFIVQNGQIIQFC